MAGLPKQVLVAYAGMEVLNPFSLAALDRLLAVTGLPPGARTLDLGCGNGAVARHVALSFGLDIDAVERDPEVAGFARGRSAGLEGPGAMRVHQADALAFLADAAPYDLVIALGVSGVVEGPPEPKSVMAALKPHVRPGGWLLWGDPFLKKEPSPPFAALLGRAAAYESHGGNVFAGEAAGLEIWAATVSSDQDWEAYVWENNVVTRRWLDANPHDPQAEEVRARGQFLRAAYLMEGRETLGFGLYLFRRAE